VKPFVPSANFQAPTFDISKRQQCHCFVIRTAKKILVGLTAQFCVAIGVKQLYSPKKGKSLSASSVLEDWYLDVKNSLLALQYDTFTCTWETLATLRTVEVAQYLTMLW